MPSRALALLLVLAALWGGSFVFIRVAAPVLGAIPLAFARAALAAAVLLAVALLRRDVPAFRTRWRDFAIVGHGELGDAVRVLLLRGTVHPRVDRGDPQRDQPVLRCARGRDLARGTAHAAQGRAA